MRIAKWAARETVKVALVEYAKHQANESFDSFRAKFCGDKRYRQDVLSSPTIKPLIADQSSAEDLVMETLGCGYRFGMINIAFTDAVPGRFENGKAQVCEVKAIALNYSKYHLNHVVLDVEGWRVSVGDMVANTYDDIPIPAFRLGDLTCSNSAAWLNEHAKEAAALECSIPGMAEGDCQALIAASSEIDVSKVKAIESQAADRESARQAAEQAAKEQTAKRDQVYWSKVLRAYYLANPEVGLSFSDYITRPTLAYRLDMKPDDPNELIIARKETMQPCTAILSRNKGNLEKYYKLPTIPDGYIIFSFFNNRLFAVKPDDVMPTQLYFGSGNVKSCTPNALGIDLVVDPWIRNVPSGQGTNWVPAQLKSIQW